MTPRASRVVRVVAGTSVVILLAACGSRLDPDTVAAANGGAAGEPGVAGATPGEGGAAPDVSTGGGGATSGGSAATGGGAPAGGTGSGGTTGRSPGSGPAKNDVPKGASCTGFKNQTGITDDKIILANASDISGPVPGLFEAAQDATRAYIAYFNSTSSICGRKLEMMALDSRTDGGADLAAYTKACDSAFAAVGSMSAFDSGGAAKAESCGIPDMRAVGVTPERNACGNCFGAQATNVRQWGAAVPDYVLKNHRAATQKAAMIYLNAGAAVPNAINQQKAFEQRGFKFVYSQAIDVAEFNYTPYVQKMKELGVQYVQWLGSNQGAVKLAQAMQQQGFKPDVYMLDPSAYDRGFLESGGSAVEGVTIYALFTPFEEAASNRETALYMQWLQQVRPGANPTFFGIFAWSAARLFVEKSLALGGRLTRATLVDSLKGVDGWTANGMHAPQHVGSKRTGGCWRLLTVKGGRFVPLGSSKYTCSGVIQVS
jgi:ABC-type branched-subunit amino acid transport system substrate-binding protein